MKRYLLALSVLLLSVSCGKNGLYISVDNTNWEYTLNDQSAWVCFRDDEHASIVQANYGSNYFQTMHGTFIVDGHRVDVTTDSKFTRLIRTFSHLKNSSNKNFTPLSPLAPERVEGSLLVYLQDKNLRFTFLSPDKKYRQGLFKNVTHQEGIPYGWEWKSGPWSCSGNLLEAGDFKGTFFRGDLLVMASAAAPLVSTSKVTSGTSSLAGSVWTYQTSSYPGFIIFQSATEFSRILVSSENIFSILQGKYSVKENSLEFVTDSKELNETCALSGNMFTYLEKTYSLVTAF